MLGIGRQGPLGRVDPAEVGGTRDGPQGVAAGAMGAGPAVSPGVVDQEERDAWIVLAGVTGVGPGCWRRSAARRR